MSAVSPGGFSAVLRSVGQGLALPLPRRIRILRELAYDLEELSGRLVAQGVPAEEAKRRASEALVPDDETLRVLDRLHSPWYRRVTRRVTPDRLRLAERGALALLTTSVLAVEAFALRQVDLFGDPSPFLVPVLATGAVVFALLAAKAFQLFVKGDHTRPGAGLWRILVSSGVTLGLGMAGTAFDFYRLAASLEGSPDLTAVLAPLWLGRTAVLLTVSILLALTGALGWFVMSQWVALAEGAQREVLDLPHHRHLNRSGY